MSLRKRLSLVAALSVGIAVLIAIVVCYMVVRNQLEDQVTSALNDQAAQVMQTGTVSLAPPNIPASAGGPAPYVQIVLPNGDTRSATGFQLPVDQHVLNVANQEAGTYITDLHVGANHLRVLTMQASYQGVPAALQLARPLNGIDSILQDLRLILTVLLAACIALAAALGRVGARRVLRPLGEVAEAATGTFGDQAPSVLEPVSDGQWRFDLWAANRLVLREAGLADANIHVTDVPTGDQFFSHRAQQPCGRFAAIARLDRPDRTPHHQKEGR